VALFLLDYSITGIIILLNFVIYMAVSIPLDLATYTKPNRSKRKKDVPRQEMRVSMVITFLASLYAWFLFITLPLDAILSINFLYTPLEIVGPVLSVTGLVIISTGTFIACWGRISRGKRAFSWGIPLKLETSGMYRYIRHPLYSSYIFYFAGFVLVLQSLIVIPILAGIWGYYKLSVYEEGILIEYFGEEYEKYRAKTGRFFPLLFK